MFSFFRGIFGKEEDACKEGEYKFYMCPSKTKFIKVLINPNTTCFEIFQNYQSEIISILESINLKSEEDNVVHLDDFSFVLIHNDTVNYTYIYLKLISCPHKFLQNNTSINLYFLHRNQICVNREGPSVQLSSFNNQNNENLKVEAHPDKTLKQILMTENDKDVIFQGQLLKLSTEDQKFSTKVYIKLYGDRLVINKTKKNGTLYF